MNHSALQRVAKLNIERKRKVRRYRVVSMMAALVVFCTTYALILPAITMEQTYYCGMEEHIHSADCYEQVGEVVYLCEQEHIHTDDCFDENGELICEFAYVEQQTESEETVGEIEETTAETEQQPESEETVGEIEETTAETEQQTESEETVSENEETTAETEQQTESEETVGEIEETTAETEQQTENEETVGESEVTVADIVQQSESEETVSENEETSGEVEQQNDTEETVKTVRSKKKAKPHKHTEECPTAEPETVLVCELPEHEHDDELCTVNPDTVTEAPEEWEQTLPKHFTGKLAADLVQVALSQLGYTESKTNLQAGADGNLNGYTRYGDWYGSDHGNWNAPFVNFCLYYTNSTAFKNLTAASAEALHTLWAKNDLYTTANGYTPSAGDLIFLDMDFDGKADYVGIISGYQGAAPTAVFGDWQDSVEQSTMNDSSIILGYGKTATVPAEGIAEITQPTDDADIPSDNTVLVGEYVEDLSGQQKLIEQGHFSYWDQYPEKADEQNKTQSFETQKSKVAVKNKPSSVASVSRYALNLNAISEDTQTAADSQTVPPSDEQIIDETIKTKPATGSTPAVEFNGYGGSNTSADGNITVSKTIKGTNIENVFDITLTVQSQTDLTIFTQDPDMSIVIVMDISNTMNSPYGNTTRYDAAITAAYTFIDKFDDNAAEGTNANLGFVAFNTDAHKVFDLQPCTTSTQASALKEKIEDVTKPIIHADGYADSYTRFTNIEAGLAMAYDMLEASDTKNKFIIFLSDGFPTTYMKTGTTTYKGYDPYTGSGTPGTDGVFYDSVMKVHCKYGTSYSDKAAIRARQKATAIKKNNTKIFSIGVDVAGQSLQYYINQSQNDMKSFSVVDRTGTTYEIGTANSADSFINWLRGSATDTSVGIGSGYYYDSNNSTELNAAFQQIFDEIKRLQIESTTNIWTALDPLPYDGESERFIEFIHFYDQYGKPQQALSGAYEIDGENTATFNSENGKVSWDLKNSGYSSYVEEHENGHTTYYTHTITYRVRLQNEDSEFLEAAVDENGNRVISPSGATHEEFSEAMNAQGVYPTNSTTVLTYQNVETVNGKPDYSENKTVDFPLPAVTGYLSEFSFYKVDHNGEPMDGITFTLAHDTVSCPACRGDGTPANTVGPYTAVSGADGKVSFTKIPSGHIYTLTETLPEYHINNGDKYTVQVAYNDITISVTHTDGTTEVLENGIGDIENKLFYIPDTESLIIRKHLNAQNNEALSDFLLNNMTFRFRVMKADENGNATNDFFLPPGTIYTVYENGTTGGTGVIGEDGTFTVKADQIIVFDELLTRSDGDSFVVQELMSEAEAENYTVTYATDGIDGIPTVQTADGKTVYSTASSPIRNAVIVDFNNTLDVEKLGNLTITKTLGSNTADNGKTFYMQVALDGNPVPVGTVYTVGGERREVTQLGIVELSANETAVFKNLPAGLSYSVRELLENAPTVGAQSSNVALGKNITATNTSNTSHQPALIVDGKTSDVSSYWDGDVGPQSFTIDLGAKYQMDYFRVYNYNGDSRHYIYVIETSLDNVNFTQVASTGSLAYGSSNSNHIINIAAPVDARYVKVTVSRPSDEKQYVHCIEFQVFGKVIDESAYSATYNGTVADGGTVNVSADGASGVTGIGGNTNITVTNTMFPFSTSVPITKTVNELIGTASFNFNVEQVQNGTWEPIAAVNGTSLTVSDSAAATGNVDLVFAANTNGTYYYKISEENTGGHFYYDNTFYIVEVKAENSYAYVSRVLKNGKDEVSVSELSFVNTATVDLNVTKIVDAPGTSGEFNFTATVTKDGEAVDLSYLPESPDYTVDGNVITFTLEHNENILLSDLPCGVTVTVTEEDTTGVYLPYHRVEGTDIKAVYGAQAEVELTDTTGSVTFVNKAYYELPETGGSGTYLYTLGGLLMTAAAIFLLYKQKRIRKGENALS